MSVVLRATLLGSLILFAATRVPQLNQASVFSIDTLPPTCRTGDVYIVNTTYTVSLCNANGTSYTTLAILPTSKAPGLRFGEQGQNMACSAAGRTTYLGLNEVASTTENAVLRYVAPATINVHNFTAKIQGANVPAGEVVDFRLMKNGLPTPANCTVMAGNTFCTDAVGQVTYDLGDLGDVRFTCSGGPLAIMGPITTGLAVR